MERADLDRIEQAITHELTERFGVGTVQRAVVLQYGDEPEIGPGQLLVRVFIPAPGAPAEYEQALAEWEQAHRAGMDNMRRELSLRLPSARVLEFTFDVPGAEVPRIRMPDDGSLADEQMSGREIVTTPSRCSGPTTCSPSSPSRRPSRSRPGWRPASTTTWTRSP